MVDLFRRPIFRMTRGLEELNGMFFILLHRWLVDARDNVSEGIASSIGGPEIMNFLCVPLLHRRSVTLGVR